MMIAIIAAGWYRCHLASVMMSRGEEVFLYEADDFFAGASGANQSRLHLGWHYPRCSITRTSSRRNWDSFLRTYGFLTSPIKSMIYAVADDSHIDFPSYLAAVTSDAGGTYEDVTRHMPRLGIRNCQGAVRVEERLILQDRAREYFRQKLTDRTFKERIDHGRIVGLLSHYDFVIDTTYAAFRRDGVEHYEPCVIWRVRGDPRFALTVMDGPYGSIMPSHFDGGEITLTTVQKTPLAKVATYAEAAEVARKFDDDHRAKFRHFEMSVEIMARYIEVPMKETTGYRIGIRAKPKGAADTRQCLAFSDEDNCRLVHVRPGKIDGIFTAEEMVWDIIYKISRGPGGEL